jgi:hypothetical protein
MVDRRARLQKPWPRMVTPQEAQGGVSRLQTSSRRGMLAAAQWRSETMGRTILGMLAGVVVAVLVIMAMEMLGHRFYPPPPGLDPTDPANEAAFAQFVAAMPFGGKLMLLLAWLLGTFAGALVAARIARHQTAAALLVALVVISGVIGMIMSIPHPTWLGILGVLLPIPVALLAMRLVYRRSTLPRV